MTSRRRSPDGITADEETDDAIPLGDIARQAGVSLVSLQGEVTARRLLTFDDSYANDEPREFWAAGPVEIAVWLARDDTPTDLRSRIASWNERTFTVEQRGLAAEVAEEFAIEDAADKPIALAELAAEMGIPVEQVRREYESERLQPVLGDEDVDAQGSKSVSAVSVSGWLQDPGNQDEELRAAFSRWLAGLPEKVRAKATEWAEVRRQNSADMARWLAEQQDNRRRLAELSAAKVEARKRKRRAQKKARRAGRRR